MTVEVTPVGVRCNLRCSYCYQNPMRDAGAFSGVADVSAMIRTLEEEGQQFTVFGGEPLIAPLPTLTALWDYGLRKYGANGVQTNGSLVTEEHLQAFERFKVYVGFSMDGPGELNDARVASGGPGRTEAATSRSEWALGECLRRGIPCSLIITLHRISARPDRMPRLLAWLEELERRGLTSARAHALEVDQPAGRALALDQPEQLAALRALREWELAPGRTLKFDVFADILGLLRGQDRESSCTWNACDPWTTPAVRAVDSDGSRANCHRTNKDGVSWLKADSSGYERQLTLRETPFEDGGCKGCRFFFACKGQCPGEAINGDPRNRSENCATWFGLLEDAERDLLRAGVTPLSVHPLRVPVEEAMVRAWTQGRNLRVFEALREVAAPTATVTPTATGYVPHGDAHGDHDDHTDGPAHADRGPVGEVVK